MSWNRSSLPLLLFLLLQFFRAFDHKNIINICIRVNISTQRFVSPIAKSTSAFPLCATLGLHLSGANTVFTSTTTKVFASWTTVLLLFTLLDLLYTASRMALCLWIAFQIPLHYQVLVFQLLRFESLQLQISLPSSSQFPFSYFALCCGKCKHTSDYLLRLDLLV